MPRNRIKCHKRVRAADLVPHEWNFRTHPDLQRAALNALYDQIGFARSLLAYELPDGRLKLIDGHLRRDLDPDMEVEVEVLDVNDEEARTLLLSIDPLASLAATQHDLHQRLLETTPAHSPDLEAAWHAIAIAADSPPIAHGAPAAAGGPPGLRAFPEQFLILITCRDEAHQRDLLTRFQHEQLDCKALLS